VTYVEGKRVLALSNKINPYQFLVEVGIARAAIQDLPAGEDAGTEPHCDHVREQPGDVFCRRCGHRINDVQSDETARLQGECDKITELNHAQWLALENCRLLAGRNRKDEWAQHILRFCADAGNTTNILRSEARPPSTVPITDPAAEHLRIIEHAVFNLERSHGDSHAIQIATKHIEELKQLLTQPPVVPGIEPVGFISSESLKWLKKGFDTTVCPQSDILNYIQLYIMPSSM
jgi:hypothetical protein